MEGREMRLDKLAKFFPFGLPISLAALIELSKVRRKATKLFPISTAELDQPDPASSDLFNIPSGVLHG